jgi:zinc-ribbon domain
METVVTIILGLAVASAVLLPLMARGRAFDYDWDGSADERSREGRRETVEADVLRYREAMHAGTICTRCAQANPAGSRFCMDCGRKLMNAPAHAVAEPVAG